MFQRRSRQLFLFFIALTTVTLILFYYKEPTQGLLYSSGVLQPSPPVRVSQQVVDANDISKMLVVASQTKDDTRWIDDLLPDWDYVRYMTDEPRGKFNVPLNKGNEAMVYLTYIIDHYHDLPDIIVFIHGERFQWHNDDPFWDNAWLISHIQIPHVLSRPYTNLRCVWTLGCPSDIKGINQPWPSYFDPDDEYLQHHLPFQYAVAFPKLFPSTPVPAHISAPCCAQFAILRSSVQRLPLSQYNSIRTWLLETKLENDISGRVFEFAWHIMFGAKAFECPNAEGCYCDLYGVCDLSDRVMKDDDEEQKKGCERESCGDRWNWPPDGYDGFPKGWPEVGWDGEVRSKAEIERMRREGKADMGKKREK